MLVTPEMLAAIQQRRLEEAKADASENVFLTDNDLAKKRRVHKMSLAELGKILSYAGTYLDGRYDRPDARNIGGDLLQMGTNTVFALGNSYLEGKTTRMYGDLVFSDHLKAVQEIFADALEESPWASP